MAKRKPKKEEEKATAKIKFLLSPTGKYNLGYSIGEEVEFDTKKAKELVDACYAEYVK
jgi:hypothetical protein